MRWLDVTRPIAPGMAVYAGDPPVELRPWTELGGGADFAVTALALGTHTGTHVDAPAHCFAGGAGVDALSLDLLCGTAFVLDLAEQAGDRAEFSADVLNELPRGCKRLLLRTYDGGAWEGGMLPDAGLSGQDASRLIERGVRLVGIDRLSIAQARPLPVHRLLLGAGVIILEGLDLSAAPAGPCELFCLPLKLAGADGAPARVLLRYR
ncbi:MAG TPA: cyclase family protein [Dehalococcoidia bacterium]|nr:cyclase family protein [Dehalococcoidia bacterium]